MEATASSGAVAVVANAAATAASLRTAAIVYHASSDYRVKIILYLYLRLNVN